MMLVKLVIICSWGCSLSRQHFQFTSFDFKVEYIDSQLCHSWREIHPNARNDALPLFEEANAIRVELTKDDPTKCLKDVRDMHRGMKFPQLCQCELLWGRGILC